MTFVCDMIYFVTVLIFGVAVSTCFCGVALNRKNLFSMLLFCVFEGALQTGFSYFISITFTRQLYPVITHLPLVLFLVFIFKRPWLNSVVSVLTAYLCCQIPWWCAHFFHLFFDNQIAYTAIYVFSALLTFYILYRYIADLTYLFMKQTRKNALLLGIVPLCYYLFDYATTVYTDYLYSGNQTAVQFMPTVIAFFYFIFITSYYRELTLQEQAKRRADSLGLQLEHAAITLNNMRALQTQTITYRHDMRHHCAYLKMLAATGDLPKITSYLDEIQSDIDAVTPKKFCGNELVNLILSTYYTKALEKNISLDIHAPLPETLPISDTKLCAILSNALENALHATEQAVEKRIQIRLMIRNAALLIQISNPFTGTVAYDSNIPVSEETNHGYGTKSIAAIVDSYHGQYEFSAENQIFTLRVLLPLSSP